MLPVFICLKDLDNDRNQQGYIPWDLIVTWAMFYRVVFIEEFVELVQHADREKVSKIMELKGKDNGRESYTN